MQDKNTFFDLTVSNIVRETKDAVVVEFAIAEDLRQIFSYIPGQNITIEATIAGKKIRRGYSICNVNNHFEQLDKLQVAIKAIDNGVFSQYANSQLKIGEKLAVMPPSGFFYLPESNGCNYLFIAAGSGITPIIAIMADCLINNPKANVTLIYSNKNQSDIMFLETLSNLKDKYKERFMLFHVLTQEKREIELLSGRLTAERINIFASKFIDIANIDYAFLCGPYGLVDVAKSALLELGINKEKIKTEIFMANLAPNIATNSAVKTSGIDNADKDITNKAKLTFTLHGQTKTIEINANVSILDAISATGSEAPYACKGGMCATCKCKLVAGEVDMKVNYALEEQQLNAGMILSCQSFIKSNDVNINFDS